MTNARYVLLSDRGIVTVTGDDRGSFLQGLISNDITRVDEAHAVYAAFLTAQGKYLHDFFVVALADDSLALDCEAGRSADLIRRLRTYKLRAKVAIEEQSGDWAVAALFGGADVVAMLGLPAADPGVACRFGGGVAYIDPRLAAAGARALLPRAGAARQLEEAGFVAGTAADYDRHRIALGLPDGSRDMDIERAILLECGFDELNGVDWNKGCFLGQELTARTKYRALIRKRLVPVAVDGPLPPRGTPVLYKDREVGEVRSGNGACALAMLRVEALGEGAGEPAHLTAGEASLIPRPPPWLKL